jgi:hypothetical protein
MEFCGMNAADFPSLIENSDWFCIEIFLGTSIVRHLSVTPMEFCGTYATDFPSLTEHSEASMQQKFHHYSFCIEIFLNLSVTPIEICGTNAVDFLS